MPEPDDDLARLQRLAFGSGASDAERADAARELDALIAARADASAAEAEAEGADGTPGARAAAEGDAMPVATPELADDVPDGAEPAATRRTWLARPLVVGAAALVVGLLAGWQLGTGSLATADASGSTPTPTPTPTFEGPRTMAEYLATQPLASDAPVGELFERPATDADVPPLPVDYDLGRGPLEFRALANRTGGGAADASGERFYFAARDEVDVCLLIMTVSESSTAEMGCTDDGLFPVDGLRVGGVGLSLNGDLSIPTLW
ncbi:hypothetical protein [Agromyces sp. NPDC058110]|uniref:hypothetical protein n=1 Tax=Agromyces sp. NPDC058110 TaxID=3346345 RepID=UPI0036DC7FFF